MKSSTRFRHGEVLSHVFIFLVTFAQLVFFTRFHKYIALHMAEPDGSVTRISLLTDDYFAWLPIMITGSIIVIVSSFVMMIYNNYRFQKVMEILFNLIGIVITISLVSIFPFDFSVIPNETTAAIVTNAVTGFVIFMSVFYCVTGIIMFLKLKKNSLK